MKTVTKKFMHLTECKYAMQLDLKYKIVVFNRSFKGFRKDCKLQVLKVKIPILEMYHILISQHSKVFFNGVNI